jgi:hypothetical protein
METALIRAGRAGRAPFRYAPLRVSRAAITRNRGRKVQGKPAQADVGRQILDLAAVDLQADCLDGIGGRLDSDLDGGASTAFGCAREPSNDLEPRCGPGEQVGEFKGGARRLAHGLFDGGEDDSWRDDIGAVRSLPDRSSRNRTCAPAPLSPMSSAAAGPPSRGFTTLTPRGASQPSLAGRVQLMRT